MWHWTQLVCHPSTLYSLHVAIKNLKKPNESAKRMSQTIALQNHTHPRLAAFSQSERRFFATARQGPDRDDSPASIPARYVDRQTPQGGIPRARGAATSRPLQRGAECRESSPWRRHNRDGTGSPAGSSCSGAKGRQQRHHRLFSPRGTLRHTPAKGPVPESGRDAVTSPELRGGGTARSPNRSPPEWARPRPSPALTPSWCVRGLPGVRTDCVQGPALRMRLRPRGAQRGRLSLLLIPILSLILILIPIRLPLHMGLRPPRPVTPHLTPRARPRPACHDPPRPARAPPPRTRLTIREDGKAPRISGARWGCRHVVLNDQSGRSTASGALLRGSGTSWVGEALPGVGRGSRPTLPVCGAARRMRAGPDVGWSSASFASAGGIRVDLGAPGRPRWDPWPRWHDWPPSLPALHRCLRLSRAAPGGCPTLRWKGGSAPAAPRPARTLPAKDAVSPWSRSRGSAAHGSAEQVSPGRWAADLHRAVARQDSPLEVAMCFHVPLRREKRPGERSSHWTKNLLSARRRRPMRCFRVMPEFLTEKERGDSGWVLVPGHPTILSRWIWIFRCLDRSRVECEQQGYGRGMLLRVSHCSPSMAEELPCCFVVEYPGGTSNVLPIPVPVTKFCLRWGVPSITLGIHLKAGRKSCMTGFWMILFMSQVALTLDYVAHMCQDPSIPFSCTKWFTFLGRKSFLLRFYCLPSENLHSCIRAIWLSFYSL